MNGRVVLPMSNASAGISQTLSSIDDIRPTVVPLRTQWIQDLGLVKYLGWHISYKHHPELLDIQISEVIRGG